VADDVDVLPGGDEHLRGVDRADAEAFQRLRRASFDQCGQLAFECGDLAGERSDASGDAVQGDAGGGAAR